MRNRKIPLQMFTKLAVKIQILAVLSFCLLACQNRFERNLQMAEVEAKNGHFRKALSLYQTLLSAEAGQEVELKAAREGGRIAYFEVKDYLRALQFYRHMVYNSPNAEEALLAQRRVVAIYLEYLADYEKTILETAKLIEIEIDPVAKVEAKLKLARSHYHLNRFHQAHAELLEARRMPESSKLEFELKLLKANVLTADKKFFEAVVLLKELMSRWRERSIKENVPMTLAVCYEEMRDFKSAITVLESVKSEHEVPEYVELRLKRLAERQKNLPGARGFRK